MNHPSRRSVIEKPGLFVVLNPYAVPSMVQKHPLELNLLRFAKQHRMILPGDPLLAGVSGGPDSVALLHILVALRDDLQISRMIVVHFDHGLRGVESADDRLFVERLALELGLECECGAENVRDVARSRQLSMEMAARFCRHRFFQEVKAARTAQRIALAHTANDQAEEVLLRLCRGAGPSGLGGMRPREDTGIVRPLLFATKSQILSYLFDRGLTYRLDSTNQAPICQRNRLRLQILPLLEEILHPGVVPCIERHALLVQEEEELWAETLEKVWPTVCEVENQDRIGLRHEELAGLHRALLRRLLRHALKKLQHNLQGIYSSHIELLCDLAVRPSSGCQVHLPGMLWGEIRGSYLLLRRGKVLTDAAPLQIRPMCIHEPGTWQWGDTTLKVEQVDQRLLPRAEDLFMASPNRVGMDAETVQWPLCLRSWMPGDRFQPLGLGKSKKLQDFFVDLKVPRAIRGNVPILCDQEKICWVVGYRLDDRVRINASTRSFLVVERLANGSPE
jgi:tRNA(Ile)-lysidine synthase